MNCCWNIKWYYSVFEQLFNFDEISEIKGTSNLSFWYLCYHYFRIYISYLIFFSVEVNRVTEHSVFPNIFLNLKHFDSTSRSSEFFLIQSDHFDNKFQTIIHIQSLWYKLIIILSRLFLWLRLTISSSLEVFHFEDETLEINLILTKHTRYKP